MKQAPDVVSPADLVESELNRAEARKRVLTLAFVSSEIPAVSTSTTAPSRLPQATWEIADDVTTTLMPIGSPVLNPSLALFASFRTPYPLLVESVAEAKTCAFGGAGPAG